MREAKEASIRNAILNNNNDNGGGGGAMTAVHCIRSIHIEAPHHEDCLFVKGSSTMSHLGNVAMRRLLNNKLAIITQQQQPKRKDDDSNLIASEIVAEMKRGMGKFLKEDDTNYGLFVEVEDAIAKKKIGIAYRDLKKRRKQQQLVQQKQQQKDTSIIQSSCISTDDDNKMIIQQQ